MSSEDKAARKAAKKAKKDLDAATADSPQGDDSAAAAKKANKRKEKKEKERKRKRSDSDASADASAAADDPAGGDKQQRRLAKKAALDPDAADKHSARAARFAKIAEEKKAREKAKKAAAPKPAPKQKKAKLPKAPAPAAAAPAPAAPEAGTRRALAAARLAEQEAHRKDRRVFNESAEVPFPTAPPFEVFLKYLPHDATEQQVSRFFAGCGEMLAPGPKLMRHHQSGAVIRGFVNFGTADALRSALALNLSELGGRRISVTVATTKGTLQQEGTHTPALYREVLREMRVSREPSGSFVDGTFGRGGHTRLVVDKLAADGHMHAFDMDPEAVEVGRTLEDESRGRFTMHHSGFADMANRLEHGSIWGILLDLGISSPQLDGDRGFRCEVDGPMDMRYDVSEGTETAWEYVNRAPRAELAAAIEEYGGEHPTAARRIADAIALCRDTDPAGIPTRTRDFAALVARAKGKDYQAMHPAKLTFQALRIVVNKEFSQFREGLEASLKVLRPGGKVLIITWKHSECNLIVDFVRSHELARPDHPLSQWFERQRMADPSIAELPRSTGVIMEDPCRPTPLELSENSRSRSAVLHVLRKANGVRLADLEAACACTGCGVPRWSKECGC